MNEEQECINELKVILEEYRFSNKIISAILALVVLLIVFAICSLAGMLVGYILVVAIAGFLVCMMEKFNITIGKPIIPDGKLAYRACSLMEILIDVKREPCPLTGCRILTVGAGQHKELYEKFIALYPYMASPKLKRLASIKVSDKDTYD